MLTTPVPGTVDDYSVYPQIPAAASAPGMVFFRTTHHPLHHLVAFHLTRSWCVYSAFTANMDSLVNADRILDHDARIYCMLSSTGGQSLDSDQARVGG